MRHYQICAAAWLLFASLPAVAALRPTFEKDIRPILKAHCFECHGEGEKLKGGLDHTKLIYHHNGQEQRLTDNKPCRVVTEILREA